jgi:hypothetical protein
MVDIPPEVVARAAAESERTAREIIYSTPAGAAIYRLSLAC